jgi:hypothetical protein
VLPYDRQEGRKAGLVFGLALSATALALPPRATGFQGIAKYLFLLGAYRGFVVTAAPLWFEQLGLFCFS